MSRNGLRRRHAFTGANKNNATNNSRADEYATQHDLYGPISGELLVDPVRISGELSPGAFERENITRWLNQTGRSPTTRNPATVDDLVPANDIREEIRQFVRRYPNAQIVRDWLQRQPAWYTRAIQEIRNFTAPVVATMTRAAQPIRQVMPSGKTCAACCAKTAETGAGAVLGAGVGACAGCICALGMAGNDNAPEMSEEEKASLMAAAVPAGAALGAVTGACLGPQGCLDLVGEVAEKMGQNNGNYWGGKRKRKTRKGKRKKKRKTHKRKHKHKKTIKKKRRRRGKKSRKR